MAKSEGVNVREIAAKSKVVLVVSAVIVIAFTLVGAIFPDGTGVAINAINAFLCDDLGWFYLVMTFVFLAFGLAVAFSKFGGVKLGKDDEKPEFGNFQWFALLFGGGIGIGLVFWSVAEPMMHFESGAGLPEIAGTAEAIRRGIRICFMHEGVHCWALFAVVGLALGYAAYRKELPFLISSTLHPLIGERIYGPIGKIVDIIAVFATVFGISTSLGLAAMQIMGGVGYIWGVNTDPIMTAILIGAITALFTLATVSGLHKWMAKVVNIKVWISVLFFVWMLVFGGFVFIMDHMSDTLGAYLGTFLEQSFWYGNSEWLSGWTVFYFAWWIAWATFCGTFFARVSRGRTIRQMMLGGTLLPAGFSFIWITIYAGAAFNLDTSAAGAISQAVNVDYTTALYALLQQLPLYEFMAPLALLLVVICFVGAADSSTFVLPMLTTGGEQNPPRTSRAFWGVAQGAVTIVLILIGGESALKTLQTASVAAAFPFIFVMILMCIGTYKALHDEMSPNADATPLWDAWLNRRKKKKELSSAVSE